MKLHDLVAALRKSSATFPRFVFPDGDYICAHAHISEVGHVVKNLIDCAGLTGREEKVLLQTHVGNDTDHRLKADRFAQILELGNRVLPHTNLDVEVEYDCCVVAQYPIIEIKPAGDHLDGMLWRNRTRCRAQERRKNQGALACCEPAATCC